MCVCVCVCLCLCVGEEGVSVSVSMHVCKNVNVHAFMEGHTHMNNTIPIPSLTSTHKLLIQRTSFH